ncbi:MAG: PrgI family protein [Patescibacteria group bacterium]
MENHPIPQDITGFQFKLIGAMTIKQFAYLISGIILAWIMYILPISAFIKIPIALLFIFFGFALAFIPIGGRPMDIMLGNLFKALFSPTQYIYKKTGGDISRIQSSEFKVQNSTTKTVQVAPVQATQVSIKPKAQGVPFQGFGFHLHKPKPADKKLEEKKANVDEGEIKKQYEDARQTTLQKELEIAKEEEERAEGQPSFEEAHEKVLSLSSQLQQTVLEKEELQRQLIELQKRLMKSAPLDLSQNQEPTIPVAPAIKNATPQKSGVVLTPEAPNVIMGVIKDPRGNPLPNILVEVKDLEENPVRAFKTNGLGQFASATPLTNGSYTIHLEDPKENQKFDPVKFDALGEIIPPIEVISVDEREELRRSLFS